MEQRWDEMQRQLGRIEAAQERAAEDRRENNAALKDFKAVTDDLRGAVSGLTQSFQSMTTQVLALNAEKCGQRLDAMEEKSRHYDSVLGQARTFVWRVLLMLAGAAIAGASAVKVIDKIV